MRTRREANSQVRGSLFSPSFKPLDTAYPTGVIGSTTFSPSSELENQVPEVGLEERRTDIIGIGAVSGETYDDAKRARPCDPPDVRPATHSVRHSKRNSESEAGTPLIIQLFES